MKKRAAKAAIVLLELLAILIAAGAAGAIYLYWRLGQGPVALDLFQTSAMHAIERRLPLGYDASVSDLELRRGAGRGEYLVTVGLLRITDADGVETASAADISFLFAGGDILSRGWGPRSVRSSGAKFKIIRDTELDVQIPGAPDPAAAPGRSVLPQIFQGGFLRSAFREAVLADAEVFFHDMSSGRMWRAPSADVVVRRDENGLKASLVGDIDINGAPAGVRIDAQYTEESDTVSLSADGVNFPVGDVLSTFYGDGAAILDAALTGSANILMTGSGDVLASSMHGRIEGGRMTVGGLEKPVSHIEWRTSFDPGGNDFTIDQLTFDVDGTYGEVAGVVRIAFADDIRRPNLVLFDLSVDNLNIDAGEALPEPLPFEEFAIAGGYQVQDRRLSVNSFQSSFLDVAVNGALAFTFPRRNAEGVRPSIGVNGELAVEGALDPQRLLKIWPRGLAMGARDWIAERLPQATIDNVRAEFDVAPGAGEGGGLPDEALTVTFDVSDAVAYYINAMTPLTGAAGKGVLRGNSFTLTADKGAVGSVSIRDGEILFPQFYPKWRPTYYRFTAAGASQDILSILDQEPLQFLSKVNLSPAQFSGEASARVEIMRPNKREVLPEEYAYSGTARFENMTVTGLAGDVELTQAAGEIDIGTRSMRVTSEALLANDAPINLVWNQNFFETDGPSTIEVAGEIDSSTGDLFGVPSRQFLHGPVLFSAKAVGQLGGLETLDINADFSQASLTVDALAWRKPAGSAASGDLSVRFSPGVIAIEKINIAGDNIGVEGEMTFAAGGGLQAADLRRIYLTGAADFSLQAGRDVSGALSLTAIGDYLNAAPMIEQAIANPALGGVPVTEQSGENDEGWGAGIAVTARIEQLELRNNVQYRAASFDLRRDSAGLQALDFSALGRDGAPLRIAMELTGAEQGPSRFIEARSGAIGDLLGGVFGVSSISGGEGSMRLYLPTENTRELTGVFEARDLHVVNAPLLARIFSAGSLDGLSNLVNGKGIDFNYAYGEFDFSEGVLMISDARATGPSVGLTAEGGVATAQGGQISLVGAVAPVYQLNAALGNAPIIGDILVGKKGEGVLALSYSISGETASPSVFVNPLSALTPGVFRQLMQLPAPGGEAEDLPAAPENPPPVE